MPRATPLHLPVLIGLLARRDLRQPVRAALLALGQPAFDQLARALRDPSLPRNVRIHVPRTISRFDGQQAADVLLAHLLEEPSGTVRFKGLRGLGRLVTDHPELVLDPARLDAVIEAQLSGGLEALHWRLQLQRGAEAAPERRTDGYQLLEDLLMQRESLSLERLLRALALKYPHEDLARVHEALSSSQPAVRSTGRELLHSLLPPKMRGAVTALVDDGSDTERLAAAKDFIAVEDLAYEDLLAKLVDNRSITLSRLAAYHAGELGLSELAGARAEGDEADDILANLRHRPLEPIADPAPLGKVVHA